MEKQQAMLSSSVKFSEHRQQVSLPSGRRNLPEIWPRVVRISVTDGDATDSSDDDEEKACFGRRRVKRYVTELRIQPCGRGDSDGADVKPEPADSGYNSGDDSHHQLSPKSVLGFASSASNGDSHSPHQAEAEAVKMSHSPSSPENLSTFSSPFDTLFPNDLFEFEDPLPVPVPGLFDEMGLCNYIFEEACTDTFIGSSHEFGLEQSTWPADNYFQEFGDIFGSDPLVAL
nr:ethylene-responsive transcription factor CRF2 [Ipomoea batatas]